MAKIYVATKEELEKSELNNIELKMLGWSTPKECPIQNEVNGNKFIQKVGRVDLGNLDWSYNTTGGTVQKHFTHYFSILANAYGEEIGDAVIHNCYITTDKLELVARKEVFNINYTKDNVYGIGYDGKVVSIRCLSITSIDDFKTEMQGVYLYYELATPIESAIDGNEVITKILEKINLPEGSTIKVDNEDSEMIVFE